MCLSSTGVQKHREDKPLMPCPPSQCGCSGPSNTAELCRLAGIRPRKGLVGYRRVHRPNNRIPSLHIQPHAAEAPPRPPQELWRFTVSCGLRALPPSLRADVYGFVYRSARRRGVDRFANHGFLKRRNSKISPRHCAHVRDASLPWRRSRGRGHSCRRINLPVSS